MHIYVTLPCIRWKIRSFIANYCVSYSSSVFEFNEFEPRLKSAKNWFQLSAGLNLEIMNTVLNETNHI